MYIFRILSILAIAKILIAKVTPEQNITYGHNGIYCNPATTLSHRLNLSDTQLPACDYISSFDTYGQWISKSMITRESRKNLKYHIRGDIKTAYEWLSLWTPYNCSYFRYSKRNFEPSTCPRLQQVISNTLDKKWSIVFLGDSVGGRPLYCHFYTMFIHGNEKANMDFGYSDANGCGGLISKISSNNFEKNKNRTFPKLYPYNATHEIAHGMGVQNAGEIFKFSTKYLNLAWSYTFGFVFKKVIFEYLIHKLGNEKFHPHDLVLGTGIWDYMYIKADEYNNRSMIERPNSAREIVRLLKEKLPNTRIWYRNNHCNQKFPARFSDIFVEPIFREAGFKILDSMNFSIGPNIRHFTRDGLHFDRPPWEPRSEYEGHLKNPHVGEVQTAMVQSLLNQLCLETAVKLP